MTAPRSQQAGTAEADAHHCTGAIPAPTFAAYVPIVSAGVGPGARRVYGSTGTASPLDGPSAV